MRKLLGYRLKEEKYHDAVKKITGYKNWDYINCKDEYGKTYYAVIDNKPESHCYQLLKQAGVMHWFEEVYEEEKLEVGKWYWSDMGGLWFIEEFVGSGQKSYGFNFKIKWAVLGHRYSSGLKPATTKEIEQALIKEAKKRGFKEGVQIIPVGYLKPQLILGDKHFYFNSESNSINASSPRDSWINCSNPPIFRDGKWAEIIEQPNLNGKTAIIDSIEYELKLK